MQLNRLPLVVNVVLPLPHRRRWLLRVELCRVDRIVLCLQRGDEGHRLSAIVRHVADRSQLPKAVEAFISHILVRADAQVVRVIGIRVPLKVIGLVTKASVELRLLRIDSELKRKADVLDSYVFENIIANR